MHRRKLNTEPDMSKCQTSMVGAAIPGTTRQMYYCSIDNGDCRYARPFGWDYVCRHPDNASFAVSGEMEDELIIANTVASAAESEQLQN